MYTKYNKCFMEPIDNCYSTMQNIVKTMTFLTFIIESTTAADFQAKKLNRQSVHLME